MYRQQDNDTSKREYNIKTNIKYQLKSDYMTLFSLQPYRTTNYIICQSEKTDTENLTLYKWCHYK